MHKQPALMPKLQELKKTKEDLEEALELVEISRSLFQEKLAAIKESLLKEIKEDEIDKLVAQAEKLYREYSESLNIIEEYMDQTYRKAH